MIKKIDYKIKIGLIIFFALISILIIICRPTITLKGKKEISIELGKKYKEPGFSASYVIKDKKDKVKVINNVDFNKVGSYKIEYKLKENNYEITEYRIINVVDRKKPVIKLIGDSNACPGKEYVEEGYEAIDNYDEDIKDKVKIKKSKDEIIYEVKDSSNNVGEAKRKIIYQDITSPEIKLNGEKVLNIYMGQDYEEAGFEVLDNCDQLNNENVKIEGFVDKDKIGKYRLTYSATDLSGNVGSITREVNVIEKNDVPRIDGSGKIIYLTFDDGPSSSITPSLLNILKEEGIKATFFVINHSDSLNYLIKKEYDEGHTVALHSYTHNYSYIYTSAENYFSDLTAIQNKVNSIIGINSKIIRFPGGSSNTVSRSYNRGIMTYLAREVQNMGFVYFDWNVSSEDAGGARTESDVYQNVVRNLKYANNIVLLHDFEGNYKTLNAIRNIIRYGKENGYTFRSLDYNSPKSHHGINN